MHGCLQDNRVNDMHHHKLWADFGLIRVVTVAFLRFGHSSRFGRNVSAYIQYMLGQIQDWLCFIHRKFCSEPIMLAIEIINVLRKDETSLIQNSTCIRDEERWVGWFLRVKKMPMFGPIHHSHPEPSHSAMGVYLLFHIGSRSHTQTRKLIWG